eukprot:CAMPEP_0174744788 /NCGR_PEP_ID=MMETSP1094-20130205/85335_1 /TAXON_ID=156173 /ORGANISM="Chrysochromulina brevifilum, Strain UTEX LB 985" /LENGTH=81 /DNA_ID=CAMNT_0015949243 /DNA_START=51 /DNA_END=293 /DNA_ORIENTATION=-
MSSLRLSSSSVRFASRFILAEHTSRLYSSRRWNLSCFSCLVYMRISFSAADAASTFCLASSALALSSVCASSRLITSLFFS